MAKILIVEDDKELNQGLAYALRQEQYEVYAAESLQGAREIYEREPVNLVLLDVNLPDGEGFEFCRWKRKRSGTPVIFLTARDLEADMLKGYELGAEDYVTKPFSIQVLLKKIQVVLKRSEGVRSSRYDDKFLKIDFDTAKVEVAGEDCPVTPTEFRMLVLFLENAGQLLTYSLLLDRLWDSDGRFVDKHTLAVNVNRLRGKIEDEGHKYISNVYGMGYQWLKK